MAFYRQQKILATPSLWKSKLRLTIHCMRGMILQKVYLMEHSLDFSDIVSCTASLVSPNEDRQRLVEITLQIEEIGPLCSSSGL